jgi:small GTP-binding protein
MGEQSRFKIVFLGDASVGKTSLIVQFTTHEFNSFSSPTVGASNAQVSLTPGSETFSVSVWDTAGQERFRSLAPFYSRDAHLVVLVFSIASAESFAGLEEWFNVLRSEHGLTCPIILCGSKVDLRWEVHRPAVREWAEHHDCPFIFTSAQTGENVRELSGLVAEQLSYLHDPQIVPVDLALANVTEGSGCC